MRVSLNINNIISVRVSKLYVSVKVNYGTGLSLDDTTERKLLIKYNNVIYTLNMLKFKIKLYEFVLKWLRFEYYTASSETQQVSNCRLVKNGNELCAESSLKVRLCRCNKV